MGRLQFDGLWVAHSDIRRMIFPAFWAKLGRRRPKIVYRESYDKTYDRQPVKISLE